jgi:hypothetical protein
MPFFRSCDLCSNIASETSPEEDAMPVLLPNAFQKPLDANRAPTGQVLASFLGEMDTILF